MIDEAASISCGPNTDEKMSQVFDEKPKIYESLMNVFLVTFTINLSLKLMSHVHREPKHIILLNYVFLLIGEVK